MISDAAGTVEDDSVRTGNTLSHRLAVASLRDLPKRDRGDLACRQHVRSTVIHQRVGKYMQAAVAGVEIVPAATGI